jgi:hypothetical protein
MVMIGYLYDMNKPVKVPSDVVQWRIVVDVESAVEIHLARGDGRYEVRHVEDNGEHYYPGDGLVHEEKCGSDGVSVFIEEEW